MFRDLDSGLSWTIEVSLNPISQTASTCFLHLRFTELLLDGSFGWVVLKSLVPSPNSVSCLI